MRTARFEFRLDPDAKQRIEAAAELEDESSSDFARTAAIERAESVLRNQQVTVVPESFFSELLAALDHPVERSQTLTRAAERARDQIKRK